MRRRVDTWSQPFCMPRAYRPLGRNLDLAACDDAANLKRLFGVRAVSQPAAVASHAVLRATVRDRADRFLAAALAATMQARRKLLDLLPAARTPARTSAAFKVQPVPIKVQRF